jgi:ornithine carbamoyltransferase
MIISVASPKGYAPKRAIIRRACDLGGRATLSRSPQAAVRDADVIVTDTWISMGDEAERAERLAAFKGYTVNDRLLSQASGDVRVLHCLPAHRGEEISNSVIEGKQTLVWEEAENRLHAQKALLIRLLRKD